MQIARAKLPIAAGLKLPDSEYNLFQAYSDLDVYKNSGSIPGAISAITQAAETDKQQAEKEVAALRGLTIETRAVHDRQTKLADYIFGKGDRDELLRIAKKLEISVTSKDTIKEIKEKILVKLALIVAGKKTEADKLAALDSLESDVGMNK
jgi:hypothetical protein